jgi:hypothetical protein
MNGCIKKQCSFKWTVFVDVNEPLDRMLTDMNNRFTFQEHAAVGGWGSHRES